jgi:hypothetical protein
MILLFWVRRFFEKSCSSFFLNTSTGDLGVSKMLSEDDMLKSIVGRDHSKVTN